MEISLYNMEPSIFAAYLPCIAAVIMSLFALLLVCSLNIAKLANFLRCRCMYEMATF